MPSSNRDKPRSLIGRTVVVTRAAGQAGDLSSVLRALGAVVVELPTIEIRATEDWSEIDRALAEIDRFDAVLLGSENAAEFFLLRARAVAARLSIPIACVGTKTRRFLEERATVLGLSLGERIVPEVFRSEAMVDALDAHFASRGGLFARRFLIPRAAEGRAALIDELKARGANTHAVTVYQIAAAPPASSELVEGVLGADAVTFLSGETIRCFLEVVSETRARAVLSRACVAVIGPIARARAAALSVRVDVMPEEATVEGLVRALADYLGAASDL